MKTDDITEWRAYRKKISDKGGHPFVIPAAGPVCALGWMDESHTNHDDKHLLPHKSQIHNPVAVELGSELALVLATYEQSPNKTAKGDPNPDWYHRVTCENYHRIRAHQAGKLVERAFPGATNVAANFVGLLLGASKEEVSQVTSEILTPPPATTAKSGSRQAGSGLNEPGSQSAPGDASAVKKQRVGGSNIVTRPTMRNAAAAAANVPRPSRAASSSADPPTPTVIGEFARGSPMALAAFAAPLRHQPIIDDPELLGELSLLYGYFCKVGGGDGRLPKRNINVAPENDWFFSKLPAYVNKNRPAGEHHRAATLQEISDAPGPERQKMVVDLGNKAHNKFMAVLAPLPLISPKTTISQVIANHMVTNNKLQELYDVALAGAKKPEDRAIIITQLAFGAARLNAYLMHCGEAYGPYQGNDTEEAPIINWTEMSEKIVGQVLTPRAIARTVPAKATAVTTPAKSIPSKAKAQVKAATARAKSIPATAQAPPAKVPSSAQLGAKAKAKDAAAQAKSTAATAKATPLAKRAAEAAQSQRVPRTTRELTPTVPTRNVAQRHERAQDDRASRDTSRGSGGGQQESYGRRPTQRDEQGQGSTDDYRSQRSERPALGRQDAGSDRRPDERGGAWRPTDRRGRDSSRDRGSRQDDTRGSQSSRGAGSSGSQRLRDEARRQADSDKADRDRSRRDDRRGGR